MVSSHTIEGRKLSRASGNTIQQIDVGGAGSNAMP